MKEEIVFEYKSDSHYQIWQINRGGNEFFSLVIDGKSVASRPTFPLLKRYVRQEFGGKFHEILKSVSLAS